MTRRGTRGRWIVALAAVVLLVAGTFAPALSGSKRVQPSSSAGRVMVQIAKKSSSYHRATRSKPAVFQVTGPTRLKLILRSLPPAAGERAQSVRISIDGKEAKAVELKAAASRTARLAADQRPVGTSRTRTLEIPPGLHKVRVTPLAAGDEVGVRAFRRTVARATTKWVTFAPETFEQSLRVRSGEREETCYRFTPEKPVGLTVHGPTRIRAITRIDFDQNTGTTLAYVVRAMIDGRPVESHALSARVAHTVTYPERPEITPGLAREITLKVPQGTHQVEFRLEGTTAHGATAILRVPESSVKTKPGRSRTTRGAVRGS